MSAKGFRRLLANERGAAVIEMAMVAPVLALGVIGIVDVSNAYSRKLALEQGAQRAVEKIMNTTDDTTVENTLTNEVKCQVNGSTTATTTSGGQTSTTTTCNTSSTQAITVNWRLDCTVGGTTTSQSTTTSATYDGYVTACTALGGTKAGYVAVTVTDKYSPLFPVHFAAFNTSDSTYHLTATAGLRTL
jgi:Flp pilus assembly protein TadG